MCVPIWYKHGMKQLYACIWLAIVPLVHAAPYPDRFVWVFGWGLGRDSDATEIVQLVENAGRHGINGAVMSLGLDTLCKKTPDFFQRLEQVQRACEQNRVEFIPAIFSIGYGGTALSHDRNLAEGLPVRDAPFLVKGKDAWLVPDASIRVANGDFESFSGHRFKNFNFHDQPGEVSFADTQIFHGGKAAMRMENFTANQHGHGRVMQEIQVHPYRCYRVTLWVKTEGLKPANAFRVMALAGKRELAPREFSLPSTTDWRRLTMVFNSLGEEKVRLYAGMWGGRSGKLWLDDWTIEEIGPMNVLNRPGTPVTVKNEDGSITYVAGLDYAPLVDPNLNPYRPDANILPLKILPGSRIQDGQRLRVSWYHSMLIHSSQVTVCMGEPALYEIFDHEARLLAEKVRPKRVLLNMDEVRMGGTCMACAGRNMGQLLGECVTRQVQALRKYIPGVEVYIWSDMLDPNHNAHGDYYLVQGDFTGSWQHVPKDIIFAVWGGAPREKSLRFAAEQGFRTLVACYYDADDLKEVKAWIDLARTVPKVRGFMYTPWQKKYALLPEFGDLLKTTESPGR